jgi:hypothetical protein
MMHEAPGVEVRRDVRHPAKNDSSRQRQFDVLLIGNLAGYQTVLAVECKNHKRRKDVGDVGRFRDHLEDVGLAPQQSIIVSANGFTSGAIGRAEELGMRTYELSGLSPDRLSEAVHEASQRVAKIAPYYRERRLEVRAHVVVLHEVRAVVHELVVHLCPRRIFIGHGLQRVLIEWNERRAA